MTFTGMQSPANRRPCLLQLQNGKHVPSFTGVSRNAAFTKRFFAKFCELGMMKSAVESAWRALKFGRIAITWYSVWLIIGLLVITFLYHMKVVDLLNLQYWMGGPWVPQAKKWMYIEQSLGADLYPRSVCFGSCHWPADQLWADEFLLDLTEKPLHRYHQAFWGLMMQKDATWRNLINR